MKIEIVPIDSIRGFERNPRLIPKDAVDSLAKSIQRLGFRNPIQIDADGVIIAGHTRWLAARQLKLAKVPVIRHEDMSEDEVRALRISDNKLGEATDWSNDILADELQGLADAIPLELLGFSEDDIGKLFDLDAGDVEAGGIGTEPAATCRSGDVWQLGEHQLVVGDGRFGAADRIIEAWQKSAKSKATLDGDTYAEVKRERANAS